jgi:uncharacterized protein YraI
VVLSSATGVAAPAFTAVSATLRDGPGTNFPGILVIPRGTEVEVIGCERGWCEVELDVDEGFIREDLLNFLDAGPPIVVFRRPFISMDIGIGARTTATNGKTGAKNEVAPVVNTISRQAGMSGRRHAVPANRI